MNTGFSWVRIDKGNIHCNFRYMNHDQVETVIKYLQSYYEYRNVNASIVDLGGAVLPESAAHYKPTGDIDQQDPNSYYFLVELHRHGTIIPQGCVEIMKTAINGIAQHQIIPESVFINKMKSNRIDVNSTETLHAVSTATGASSADFHWMSEDPTVISVDPDGFDCVITTHKPGETNVIAEVSVPEEAPRELGVMPEPTAYWLDNVVQYTGSTVTYKIVNGKFKPSSTPTGVEITFTHNNYYECYFDASYVTHYLWKEVEYDGSSSVMVKYRDTYDLIVCTYVRFTAETKLKQRLCLYHNQEHYLAETPSQDAVINWRSSSTSVVDFLNDVKTGTEVILDPKRVGTTTLTVSLSDAYGTYEDSMNVTVYAVDVTPDSIKMIRGATKYVYINKTDIFKMTSTSPSIDPPIPVPVEWVTSNSSVATVNAVEPDVAETAVYAKAVIEAVSSSDAAIYITAVAEDPDDGVSYSDNVRVTIGDVAIRVPSSRKITLITGSPATLTLKCDLASGFTVDTTNGWVSGTTDVVRVDSITTDTAVGDTVTLTGLEVGSSLITVMATNGGLTDTDQILIEVVEAPVVTSGEMTSFTAGKFNKHGVIDWNHPTGEEGTMEVDNPSLDLATQEEVEDFVEDLYEDESEDPETPEEPENSDDPENTEDPENSENTEETDD